MPLDGAKIPTLEDIRREKCRRDKLYFIKNFVFIYSTTEGESGEWIKFDLWDEQIEVVEIIENNQKIIILKARQVGLTWLVLAIALWLVIFKPIATILVYSARDTEAIYLLSDDRLRGMYQRLPDFLKTHEVNGKIVPLEIIDDDKHLFSLSNGSNVRAFPTSAGDSYTATLAIVDEADASKDLNKLLQRVKPTIDAGGKLILLSRSYKENPESTFKKIYRAAKEKINEYAHIFLPWWVVPKRTKEWYEKEKCDSLAAVGTLDNVYESYPATDVEALAPKEADKRFPSKWLLDCYEEGIKVSDNVLRKLDEELPHNLIVYELPNSRLDYVIGADPAEGNPSSDDSALCVSEKISTRQVAKLAGKFEPRVFAEMISKISVFYNNAPALIERNNHGHAVIQKCQDLGVELLNGYDEKPGWLNNSKGKVLLYDHTADLIRTTDCKIVDFRTYSQLASIEASTLLAPEGLPDDEADAFCLANKGAVLDPYTGGSYETGGSIEHL